MKKLTCAVNLNQTDNYKSFGQSGTAIHPIFVSLSSGCINGQSRTPGFRQNLSLSLSLSVSSTFSAIFILISLLFSHLQFFFAKDASCLSPHTVLLIPNSPTFFFIFSASVVSSCFSGREKRRRRFLEAVSIFLPRVSFNFISALFNYDELDS